MTADGLKTKEETENLTKSSKKHSCWRPFGLRQQAQPVLGNTNSIALTAQPSIIIDFQIDDTEPSQRLNYTLLNLY